MQKYLKRAAIVAGGYVANDLARSAYKSAKGRVMRAFKPSRKSFRTGRSSGTLTSQRDTTTTYGKGRRGKGRGGRQFLVRVRRALIDEQPSNLYTALFKGTDTSALGVQSFQTTYLADVNTTAQGDLWNVFKDAFSAGAVTDVEQERLYIRNMSMDIQLKNQGLEQCIVDMYICVSRVSHDSVATLNADLQGWFGDQAGIGGVSLGIPGVGLFNVPGFSRKWKITKKQSFLIKPEEVIQTTIVGRKNFMVAGRMLQDYRAALKGITMAVVFQVRGVPENSVSDSGLSGFTTTWSAQTRIAYAKVPGNVNEVIGQTK